MQVLLNFSSKLLVCINFYPYTIARKAKVKALTMSCKLDNVTKKIFQFKTSVTLEPVTNYKESEMTSPLKVLDLGCNDGSLLVCTGIVSANGGKVTRYRMRARYFVTSMQEHRITLFKN